MHVAKATLLLRTALLLAALSVPTQASAFFWSGPGCAMANLLGMGHFTGGLHFSLGAGGYGTGRGLGYGYPYGYPGAGAPPYRFAYPPPPMSPAANPPARSAPSAREILDANIWSERATDLELPAAGDRQRSPPNRWQHGR